VSFSLFQHWKEALQACPLVGAKVYRYLMAFYQEQATRIAFRRTPASGAVCPLDMEAQLKLPRSPEQIRSLLGSITKAIREAAPKNSW
jgi:hypothetical protein